MGCSPDSSADRRGRVGRRVLHRCFGTLDFALLDPTRQEAERGELLQGNLLGEVESVLVRRWIANPFKAARAELDASVLTAAPCLRGTVTAKAQTCVAGRGVAEAERLTAQLRVCHVM